jgi:hypothetical protein
MPDIDATPAVLSSNSTAPTAIRLNPNYGRCRDRGVGTAMDKRLLLFALPELRFFA